MVKAKMAAKSTSLDKNKQLKEKIKRSLSCEKLPGEAKGNGQSAKKNKSDKTAAGKTATEKAATHETVVKKVKRDASEVSGVCDVYQRCPGEDKFGPYGEPDRNKYVCTLCQQFKTKYKYYMREHLYRELNYARWQCTACGYLTVNREKLLNHFMKRHKGVHLPYEPLSPNSVIEDWVSALLKTQADIIRAKFHRASVIVNNSV